MRHEELNAKNQEIDVNIFVLSEFNGYFLFPLSLFNLEL